jgi:sugar phosphate isomerase/epimerase
MQVGIFAKTFAAQGALPVLQAVRNAGFEATQFNMSCSGLASMPDEISDDIARSVSEAACANGVTIAAVSGTYNMIHPDADVRAAGLHRLGVIMAAAKIMDTQLVTLCTGTKDPDDQWRQHRDNDTPGAWRDLTTEMDKALRLADRHDVDLGIEPELANVVSSAGHARRLLDEMKSPRLRIVFDPANLFEVESAERRCAIIADAADRLGGHIAMAHAKDRDGQGHAVAAGTGVIDFAHVMQCLKQAGFDGPLIAHGLSEAEAPAVAAFLKGVLA